VRHTVGVNDICQHLGAYHFVDNAFSVFIPYINNDQGHIMGSSFHSLKTNINLYIQTYISVYTGVWTDTYMQVYRCIYLPYWLIGLDNFIHWDHNIYGLYIWQKNGFSISKTSWLVMFREPTAVYWKTKWNVLYKWVHFGLSSDFFNVQLGCTHRNH